MNEIRKCECGGAIIANEDPEVDHQFECSICFDTFNECGHMLGSSLNRCKKLIPPEHDACEDHGGPFAEKNPCAT